MFVPIIALLSLCTVQSFPTGAPNATCTSMEPKHEVEAQKGVSPYTVSVNSTTVSSPARGITGNNYSLYSKIMIAMLNESKWIESVTIESPKQEQFRGFFLQARFGNQTIGSFSVPKDSDAKFIDCDNKMKVSIYFSTLNYQV